MLTCAESLQLADLMGVLTPAAMRLHFIIRGLTPATGGPTRPSTAKLCELTGMHETTVRAGLRELEKVGIVITERKHDRRGAQLRNAYTLCVNAIRGVAAMARPDMSEAEKAERKFRADQLRKARAEKLRRAAKFISFQYSAEKKAASARLEKHRLDALNWARENPRPLPREDINLVVTERSSPSMEELRRHRLARAKEALEGYYRRAGIKRGKF